MATSTPVRDLDEKFLQCPICMDQFVEPKILPCLHRFCEGCLLSIPRGTATKLECPTCRHEHKLSDEGIKGLKTDYNTKNLIEFTERQRSAANVDFRVCANHPEIPLELCCTTCGNQSICVTCSINGHKSHALDSLTSVAKLEKRDLSEKLKEFMQYTKKIDKMQEAIEERKRLLPLVINGKRTSDREEFESRKNYLDRELRGKDELLREQKVRKVERNARLSLGRKGGKHSRLDDGRDRSSLERELNELRTVFDCLQITLQEEEKSEMERVRVMSDNFVKVKKKFKQIKDDALGILREKRNWVIVQGIPDICSRMNNQRQPAEQIRQELSKNLLLASPNLSVAIQEKRFRVDIVEKDARDLGCVRGEGWSIDTITGSHDGGLLVTGQATHWQTHITVFDSELKQVKRDVLDAIPYTPRRFCEFLSGSRVATVSHHNEIGVYDTRDGQYVKKDIHTALASCPVDRCVSCLCVDRPSTEILVASVNSKRLEIFDSDLKHVKTMKLPKKITSPINMTVHGADLIVLDVNGASAVTTKGSKYQLQYELNKPDHGVVKPVSACRDRNGFVYVLWRISGGEEKSLIAEYRGDGGQIIHSTRVHEEACSMTTVVSEEKEVLFVTTRTSGKLFVFQLVRSLGGSEG